MERSHILDMMGSLKLYGMRTAYDEIMASSIKRQHEPPKIVGDLLPSHQQALRAHLDHRLNEPGLRRMASRLRRRKDDRRSPRQAHSSLRDHRNRK